ncbi:unnamed protein product [Caretta caretta]
MELKGDEQSGLQRHFWILRRIDPTGEQAKNLDEKLEHLRDVTFWYFAYSKVIVTNELAGQEQEDACSSLVPCSVLFSSRDKGIIQQNQRSKEFMFSIFLRNLFRSKPGQGMIYETVTVIWC